VRCKACNVALSDQESTRKYIDSEEYTDLCNTCYYAIDNEELDLPLEVYIDD